MSLINLNIRNLYNSYDNNIIDEFYKPIIKESNNYKRSTGYFSTAFINNLYEEINSISEEKEYHIQILCSPNMSKIETDEIKLGYDLRKEIENQISSVISEFDISNASLPAISKLIGKGVLDIKFVIPTNGQGLFHEKKGIFIDEYGYKIAFLGSNNETVNAAENNYESFVTIKSDINLQMVTEIEEDFDKIWTGEKVGLITYEVSSVINESIYKKYEKSNTGDNTSKSLYPAISMKYNLHDYQKEAVNLWLENDGVGLLEMATGTGKTITALSCYEHLCQTEEKLLTVIVVPQIDLIHQWAEDIEATGSEVIKCFGDNPIWENELRIKLKKLHSSEKAYLTVLVTRSTFVLEKFNKRISKNKTKRLLIADEVHSFGSNNLQKIYEDIRDNFQYRLGISATPFRRSEIETDKLIQLFDKVVFEYSLKKAIKNGFLNKYEYYPKILFFDNEQLKMYRKTYQDNKEGLELDDRAAFDEIERITSRIMNSSTSKVEKLIQDINNHDDRNFQAIVYCSPGGYNDTQQKYDNKHVGYVSKQLGKLSNVDLKIVTSGIKNEDRKIALQQFREKKINTLVAIKCLDQGINLKGVTEAYILSSTDSETEFIQRRGRILRNEPNKPISKIIDYVMFPQDFRYGDIVPHESEGYVVSRELKRMKSYAAGAENETTIIDTIINIENIYYDQLLEEKDYEFVSK